ATASSTLAVSFSAAGNCTLNGAQVHLMGGGICTVTASQSGDNNHNAAPDVARSFVINKAIQTISFGALPDKTFGDAPFVVDATASSGLAVSLQVISGPATLNGNTVTITGAGIV